MDVNWVLVRGKKICLFFGPGTTPVSYPVWLRLLYLGVERPGCEAHHSPPQISEIKNDWSYTAIPTCVFMTQCSGQRGSRVECAVLTVTVCWKGHICHLKCFIYGTSHFQAQGSTLFPQVHVESQLKLCYTRVPNYSKMQLFVSQSVIYQPTEGYALMTVVGQSASWGLLRTSLSVL